MHKNILYITYDGLTDPLGQSQILPYIARLSFDFHITVISFEKKQAFTKNQNEIKQICKQYNIQWFALSYTKRPPIFSTIFDIFRLYIKSKQLFQKHKFDIVHCRSYIASLIGLQLKKEKNIDFIFDMRGFWADERVDGSLWNLNNFIYQSIYTFFKNKELSFLKNADSIITLTEKAKNYIIKTLLPTINPQKIFVIPCVTDFSTKTILSEQEKSKIKTSLSINEKDIVLTYLGSLGTWYLLDKMLEFFSIFLKYYPNSIFLFVTNDNQDIIFNIATQMNIAHTKIRAISVKQSEVYKYLNITNVGIFFIKPCFSKTASSPTKFAEFLTYNIPVICNNIGDLKEHVSNIDNSICIDDLNPSSFEFAIKKISPLKKASIHQATLEKYNINNAINILKFIYQNSKNE